MRRDLVLASALILASCTAGNLQQAGTGADAGVAAAQPSIELACWLAQAADAGFQIYAARPDADAAVVTDEKKAVAGAAAICAAPPADLAQAIADVMTAYKAVVAVTPART